MKRTFLIFLLLLSCIVITGCISSTGIVVVNTNVTRDDVIVTNNENNMNTIVSGIVTPITNTISGISGDARCRQTDMYGWLCINEDYDYVNYPLRNMTIQEYHVYGASAMLVGTNQAYYMVCDTHSMYPTFLCNDTLIAKRIDDVYNIKAGTIVMASRATDYQSWATNFILHRIVNTTYENGQLLYLTKGDNNDYVDDYAWKPYQITHEIIGKLVQ